MSAIELETRVCGCGCKAEFRCLPGSKQKYASGLCRQDATGEVQSFTPARRRKVKLKSEENMRSAAVVEDREDEELEQEQADDQVPESGPESDGEEAAASGSGRFTMLTSEAVETFGVPHYKLYTWIKKGYLEVHKESARKTYVDPVDIGRILEEGVTEAKVKADQEAEESEDTENLEENNRIEEEQESPEPRRRRPRRKPGRPKKQKRAKAVRVLRKRRIEVSWATVGSSLLAGAASAAAAAHFLAYLR